jgi:hypothetical protein
MIQNLELILNLEFIKINQEVLLLEIVINGPHNKTWCF